MKNFLIILSLGLALICPQLAEAASTRNPCYTTTNSSGGSQQSNCIDVGTATPLPVGVGGVNVSIPINISTATTTELVPVSGTTKVYVTSFDVIAGGTGNITFVYGTGTNCGTGTTALTGAYPLVAQTGLAKGNGSGTLLILPAGKALCATTSAAVQMSGSLTYQQF